MPADTGSISRMLEVLRDKTLRLKLKSRLGEKYALNLKREFPRISLYGSSDATFWKWAGWGEELMALHIGYETVEPFALTRIDVPDEKVRASGQSPKPSLKADKDAGRIVIDSETTLGVTCNHRSSS